MLVSVSYFPSRSSLVPRALANSRFFPALLWHRPLGPTRVLPILSFHRSLSSRPEMSHNISIRFLGTTSGGGPTETRNCSSLVVDPFGGSGQLWSAYPCSSDPYPHPRIRQGDLPSGDRGAKMSCDANLCSQWSTAPRGPCASSKNSHTALGSSGCASARSPRSS